MSNPLLSELAHTSTVRRRAAGLAGQVSSVLPVVTKPPRRLALKLGVADGAAAPNGWRRGEVSQCARGTGACAEAPAGTASADAVATRATIPPIRTMTPTLVRRHARARRPIGMMAQDPERWLTPSMLRSAASGALVLAVTAVGPASAQQPPVRLAAAKDCARNVNCIPGFKRVYRADPTSVLTTLKVADAGIQALDDGVAEVAVAFSSNPQLSRPDIMTLRDDRHMITDDHIVPVMRAAVLRRYGRPLRRRLDTASQLLSTLELRGLNQQVLDGRIPEAVGGESPDPAGLGGPHRRLRGPRIRVGYQAFDENQLLAQLYAEAL